MIEPELIRIISFPGIDRSIPQRVIEEGERFSFRYYRNFFTDDDRRAVTVEIPIHPDFINKKVDIENEKFDILLNAVELDQIFGRTDVINILDISPTAASKFIGKMCRANVLEAVEGKARESID